MYRAFRTSDVEEDRAISAWDSFVSETLIGVECASDRSGYFDATFQQLAIKDTSVSRIVSAPHPGSPINVSLSERFAREAPEDSLLMLWQKSGAVEVNHGSKDHRVTSGNVLIIDPTRAYHMEVEDQIEQVVFAVSRHKAIMNGLWSTELARSVIPLDQRQAGFMDSMVQGLCEHGGAVEGMHAYRMMNVANDIMLDHLAETVLAMDGQRVSLRRRHTLVEIKAFVESSIGTMDLTPEGIAEDFKISRRHLDSLFAEVGLTAAKFITNRRIAKASEMLSGDAFCQLSIAQIAFAVGFQDLSYFNRQFKAQIGLTPSAYRKAGTA